MTGRIFWPLYVWLFLTGTAVLPLQAQEVAVSTNLLYGAGATLNVGVERVLNGRFTLSVPASYNPWTLADNKKWKHVLLQPELRRWNCEAFNGGFWGVHAHYALFNVGGVGTKRMRNYRYEGWLAGAGVGYGYQFYLSPRFSIETSLGVGYAYLDYSKYDCAVCGALLGTDTMHYLGPTKAAVSLVYIIK